MVGAVSHIYIAAYGACKHKFPAATATGVPCEVKSTVQGQLANSRPVNHSG